MQRPRVRSLLLALAALSATGCYKASFVEPHAVVQERKDEWTSFYLFGLVGTAEVDARKLCPSSEVVGVATGANVGTGVVTVLTLGIYAPRKVYVACGTHGKPQHPPHHPAHHPVAEVSR